MPRQEKKILLFIVNKIDLSGVLRIGTSVRADQWHGWETGHNSRMAFPGRPNVKRTAWEGHPTTYEHLDTISRGKTRRGDELKDRQLNTDPRFHPEGGGELGGAEFNRQIGGGGSENEICSARARETGQS
jgi:hypothetical protein